MAQSEVDLARAETESVAHQFRQQVEDIRVQEQFQSSKAASLLRAKEQELANALAKAEELRLEVIQHSKSSEQSRRQREGAEAAKATLTNELVAEREVRLASHAQNAALEQNFRTVQEAALELREQEAEASMVATEALEQTRAKAHEYLQRYKEQSHTHQQLLQRTRKLAAEETARRANAERQTTLLTEEAARRDKEQQEYRDSQSELIRALQE